MNARRTSRTIGMLLLGFMVSPVFGQTAGMLGFQGLLKDAGGDPINGTVDLEFRIFDAETLGNLVDMDGDGVVEDVCGEDVTCVFMLTVTDGIVSTKFGPVHPAAFDGTQRWLELSVDDGSGFEALSRVEMATAPAAANRRHRIFVEPIESRATGAASTPPARLDRDSRNTSFRVAMIVTRGPFDGEFSL